jgi:hypothetical protein
MAVKKQQSNEQNINAHRGIPPAVIEEAVSLAELIASNERAMTLLHEDNKELRERLQRMFESFNIPWLKISIPITTKGDKKDYTVKMVTARGFIPIEGGIRKILSVRIKGLFPDWDIEKRKRIANKLAEWAAQFLAKNAILVTETRKHEWGKKLEEDKVIAPYLMVTEGHTNAK